MTNTPKPLWLASHSGRDVESFLQRWKKMTRRERAHSAQKHWNHLHQLLCVLHKHTQKQPTSAHFQPDEAFLLFTLSRHGIEPRPENQSLLTRLEEHALDVHTMTQKALSIRFDAADVTTLLTCLDAAHDKLESEGWDSLTLETETKPSGNASFRGR